MTAKKITASICTVAAIALAGVPVAGAQEPMSPDQQYAYSCGHLGTDCGADQASKPKKARRACSKRSRSAKKSHRRCARRAGARR